MNPGKYTMRVPQGGRYDVRFNLKDSANQPVPLAGFVPVMNVFRSGELIGSSLPNDSFDLWDIDLTWEPPDVDDDPILGRIDITIGSDVTESWLQPIGTHELGLSYRLDLLDESLTGQVVRLMYGAIEFIEEV